VLDLLPILLNELKDPLREHFHGFAVEQQTCVSCSINWPKSWRFAAASMALLICSRLWLIGVHKKRKRSAHAEWPSPLPESLPETRSGQWLPWSSLPSCRSIWLRISPGGNFIE
jgi:hypothetical protein